MAATLPRDKGAREVFIQVRVDGAGDMSSQIVPAPLGRLGKRKATVNNRPVRIVYAGSHFSGRDQGRKAHAKPPIVDTTRSKHPDHNTNAASTLSIKSAGKSNGDVSFRSGNLCRRWLACPMRQASLAGTGLHGLTSGEGEGGSFYRAINTIASSAAITPTACGRFSRSPSKAQANRTVEPG